MKISDYIVSFLKSHGVRYVFGINGSGTAVQIFDSLAREEGIDYVCTLHEQSAGMAADGYACATGGIGAAVATSGPGAANFYTCVAGAYYNSNPVMFFVGQPPMGQLRKSDSLRHYGYHENNIIAQFAPVTKYVAQPMSPDTVRYELEKACYYATEGRPGPVMLALPDDITWLDIDPEKLKGFEKPERSKADNTEKIDRCAEWLCRAERPVLMLGKGVKCAHAEVTARTVIEKLDCPVALTYGMRDFLPDDHPANVGSFGVQGSRAGCFAVQNADFILAIGSRLDPSETGRPSTFARAAKIVSVDIDAAELEKYPAYGIPCRLSIEMDAGEFLASFVERAAPERGRWASWKRTIADWRKRYPLCLPEYYSEEGINPYVIVDKLSCVLPEKCTIVTDTSSPRNYMYQAFQFKNNQKMFTWLNYACLGYALPAAIGAAYASDGMVAAVMGDGGLQFNIQELSTVVFNKLNIKIIVFDNDGYATIARTQDKYLEGRHYGSDREHGLPIPDSVKIARAYGLPVIEIFENREIEERLKEAMDMAGPVFCVLHLSIRHWSVPARMGADPIEDLTPKLPREVLRREMLIPLLGEENESR